MITLDQLSRLNKFPGKIAVFDFHKNINPRLVDLFIITVANKHNVLSVIKTQLLADYHIKIAVRACTEQDTTIYVVLNQFQAGVIRSIVPYNKTINTKTAFNRLSIKFNSTKDRRKHQRFAL